MSVSQTIQICSTCKFHHITLSSGQFARCFVADEDYEQDRSGWSSKIQCVWPGYVSTCCKATLFPVNISDPYVWMSIYDIHIITWHWPQASSSQVPLQTVCSHSCLCLGCAWFDHWMGDISISFRHEQKLAVAVGEIFQHRCFAPSCSRSWLFIYLLLYTVELVLPTEHGTKHHFSLAHHGLSPGPEKHNNSSTYLPKHLFIAYMIPDTLL